MRFELGDAHVQVGVFSFDELFVDGSRHHKPGKLVPARIACLRTFSRKFVFDLVVLINHLRAEAGAHVHPRLPCVSWIQDHMPALLRTLWRATHFYGDGGAPPSPRRFVPTADDRRREPRLKIARPLRECR